MSTPPKLLLEYGPSLVYLDTSAALADGVFYAIFMLSLHMATFQQPWQSLCNFHEEIK